LIFLFVFIILHACPYQLFLNSSLHVENWHKYVPYTLIRSNNVQLILKTGVLQFYTLIRFKNADNLRTIYNT